MLLLWRNPKRKDVRVAGWSELSECTRAVGRDGRAVNEFIENCTGLRKVLQPKEAEEGEATRHWMAWVSPDNGRGLRLGPEERARFKRRESRKERNF